MAENQSISKRPQYIKYNFDDCNKPIEVKSSTEAAIVSLANDAILNLTVIPDTIALSTTTSSTSAPSHPERLEKPSQDTWNLVSHSRAVKKGLQTHLGKNSLQPYSQVVQDVETNVTISEHIETRHRRDRGTANDNTSQLVSKFQSRAVQKYLEDTNRASDPSSWLSCPELPSTCEALDIPEPWQTLDSADNGIVMIGNRLRGPWESKNQYLSAHHEMLREEAMRPLREGIHWVKNNPSHREDQHSFGGNIGIYEKVHITAITFSNRALALRVNFSLNRVGKNIRWEQSKRLLTGSLVALTPVNDMFRTKCILAVVAARPLEGLIQNPPEIDLFFARPEEIEIDPQLEFVMVEERSSFFEASRHTMTALQKMMHEPFPLAEHIIDVEKNVQAPVSLQQNPFLDLSSVFAPQFETKLQNVDVLNDWPIDPVTELDKSQQKALHRILTKRLAIIQGPPGTGKTHVSVSAVKVMLDNMSPGDPPIIVACQTNHALDQLLRHLSDFESAFARLGGRSKDQGLIKSRTLFYLRHGKRIHLRGGMRGPARTRLDQLSAQMCLALKPLEMGKGLLDHVLLRNLNILTPAQCESLEQGDSAWSASSDAPPDELPLKRWAGRQLLENKRSFERDDFGLEYEEVDLEFEQLKELEAENCAQDDDDDFESLRGPAISLWDAYVGKPAPNISEDTIEEWLEQPNMYKINHRFRGAVYNYLQRQAKAKVLQSIRASAKHYYVNLVKFKAGGWEQDQILLREQKFIGMTTTGLSKYRALVAALNPKVVLIEEAAETLEAPVVAACVPTLEHLILVGDHRQLRPQCAVKDLQRAPFNLNVSLFERMVKEGNEVEYSMLKRQRRMIPEIRRLLKPIYGASITDHPSMKDSTVRAPIPGMGGVNSFFFTHYWPETIDELMSSTNQQEADMIVGFFEYLVCNGMAAEEITVLTFYNGQRKLILRKLRDSNLQSRLFKVVTVDSYQGEENEVIILSLVRSNDMGNIGFLSVENRICVALSRAKRGLYIFGNGELLAGESKLWAQVVKILAGRGSEGVPTPPKCRIVFSLPLTCINHDRKTWIEDPRLWEKFHGGCEKQCKGVLPCGHKCFLYCHPYAHDRIVCLEACTRDLPCGHACGSSCGDACKCEFCKITYDGVDLGPSEHFHGFADSVGQGRVDGIVGADTSMRKRLLELGANAGKSRNDLREKYLREQDAVVMSGNSELQAARAGLAVQSRFATSAQSKPLSTRPANANSNSCTSRRQISYSGPFSPGKVSHTYHDIDTAPSSSRPNSASAQKNSAVEKSFTTSDLLIDFD